MADWQGNGGTTGSSDICNVSPSDQIGTLDNILNRLQALEAALAGLLGTNVEAAQLSDISNDLGWIFNVEYLGTDGWTQTPSGTLIPPAGWTGLSSLITLGQTTLYSGGAAVGSNIMNIMTRRFYYVSDIATTTGQYIHPSLNLSSYVNIGDVDLTSTASASFGNIWVPDVDGYYRIYAYADIYQGSTPPTAGRVNLTIYRCTITGSTRTTVGASSQAWDGSVQAYTSGGNTGFEMYAFGATLITTARGFAFLVSNWTNGDIQVGDLKVVFEKVGNA